MEAKKITEGRIVTFFPSVRKMQEFKMKQKQSYPAIVTEVNARTVDLTVFGVHEIIFAGKIPHKEIAGDGKSCWDWQQIAAK